MEDALVAVASAMNVYEKKLDAVAQNVVNARLPGYVPRMVGARTFESEFSDASRGSSMQTTDGLSFAKGEIVSSKNPLAVALKDDGFFEVATPDGPAYTRGGDFELVNGAISTRGGYPVQGERGDIRFGAAGGAIHIDVDGSVMQGGASLGRIKVVRFADTSKLEAVADTLVRSRDGAAPESVSSPELAPGMVEMPAVQAVQNLVEMVSLQRGYEGAQRASHVMHDAFERMLRSPN